jgi:hypothetical protein
MKKYIDQARCSGVHAGRRALAPATYQPNDKHMGSTPSGDIDPAPAGLVAPRNLKIVRGRGGCAMARDRA